MVPFDPCQTRVRRGLLVAQRRAVLDGSHKLHPAGSGTTGRVEAGGAGRAKSGDVGEQAAGGESLQAQRLFGIEIRDDRIVVKVVVQESHSGVEQQSRRRGEFEVGALYERGDIGAHGLRDRFRQTVCTAEQRRIRAGGLGLVPVVGQLGSRAQRMVDLKRRNLGVTHAGERIQRVVDQVLVQVCSGNQVLDRQRHWVQPPGQNGV